MTNNQLLEAIGFVLQNIFDYDDIDEDSYQMFWDANASEWLAFYFPGDTDRENMERDITHVVQLLEPETLAKPVTAAFKAHKWSKEERRTAGNTDQQPEWLGEMKLVISFDGDFLVYTFDRHTKSKGVPVSELPQP